MPPLAKQEIDPITDAFVSSTIVGMVSEYFQIYDPAIITVHLPRLNGEAWHNRSITSISTHLAQSVEYLPPSITFTLSEEHACTNPHDLLRFGLSVEDRAARKDKSVRYFLSVVQAHRTVDLLRASADLSVRDLEAVWEESYAAILRVVIPPPLEQKMGGSSEQVILVCLNESA